MENTEKQRLIQEIEEMRKERALITQKMRALAEHRDQISDRTFDPMNSARSYASSVRRESASEETAKREVFKNLKEVEIKKRAVLQQISKEVDEYQKKQMPSYLQIQTKAQKTRTEILNIIKQLSSALLELKPDEELGNQFRKVTNSCNEKSSFIVNKERELAQSIDEKFALMKKRYDVSEATFNNKMNDTEGLKLQIARRRTSDLPSF